MNPFIYPNTKHTRKHKPDRAFADYRRYKPFLRKEFHGQCVYCMLPDSVKGQESFGVDHYMPKKKFPHLSSEYSNLFYACNVCNSHKGDFWPFDLELKKNYFIPNPCEHSMSRHLQYDGPEVKAKTTAGRCASDVLLLNEEHFLIYRRWLIAYLYRLDKHLANIERQQRALSREMQKAHGERKAVLLGALKELEIERKKAQEEEAFAIPSFNDSPM